MTRLRRASGGQGAFECAREPQVVNAVLAGRWPDGADETLVSHAATCETCREVAAVAVLLREDVDHSRHEVHVPAAGQIWWRAAVRARLESTHAATRPITWMHGITGAIVVGSLLAALTIAWPSVPGLARQAWTAAAGFFPSPEVAGAIVSGLRLSVIAGVLAAAFLIVAPLALYLVLSDD